MSKYSQSLAHHIIVPAKYFFVPEKILAQPSSADIQPSRYPFLYPCDSVEEHPSSTGYERDCAQAVGGQWFRLASAMQAA
jgi:hypothetical protein